MSDNETAELKMSWLDCFHEDKAICPWCGYADEDSWEYNRVEYTDTECPSCGKPYTVDVSFHVEYTTEPIGGWPDDR